MRMGAIVSVPKFHSQFPFWLFISQVEKVQGNCDTLSQGLEHSKVSCYLLLKLLFVVVSHILVTDSQCY